MNQQLELLRPDGSEVCKLTVGGRTNNWLDEWSPDGTWLGYSSNRREPTRMDCLAVNVRTGQERELHTGPGIGFVADFSQDGKRALVVRAPERGDTNVFLIEADGTRVLLTPHEGLLNVRGARFSDDGRSVIVGGNLGSEFSSLSRIDIGTDGRPGARSLIASRERTELDGFEVSRDRKLSCLLWNVGGRHEVEWIDLPQGTRTPGPSLPGEVVWDLRFTASGGTLALSISGSRHPSDIWLTAARSDAVRQLTFSPHPGLSLDLLIAPELVRFKARDGLELTGWLYRPRDFRGPGPLVLSFHGGPEGQERPFFDAGYQALLATGIAVLAPNVRGSSGFGQSFLSADDGPLRVNAVRDILSCVEFALTEEIADPARIGIMGGSYGGYMTLAGLTEYPEAFAAGADLFGIVNFESFFAHSEPWMGAVSKREYGDPETQRDLLRSLSPIHRIDRVRAPTIVLHGASDTNVPVIEAEQVVEALRRRSVPVRYVLFPDEGHGFVKTKNRIEATQAIVEWFARYLLPHSQPSGSGGSQVS